MSEIVQFPGAVAPSDHPITNDEDRRHAEAFCDLESGICDCATMAKIAAQMMLGKDDGTDRELVFAVAHVSEMLDAFKANYYAAWHGERRST
jgi:hypothetical protein